MSEIILPLDTSIDISTFSTILDLKNMTNSYKIYWFAGLFDELISRSYFNRDLFKISDPVIPFECIVYRMIARAWYCVIRFKLNFGASDQLAELVMLTYNTCKKDNSTELKPDASQQDILLFLSKSDNIELKKKIEEFYKFVPYRLLSPFYSDISVPDHKKNMMIMEKSNNSEDGIYRINGDRTLVVHSKWISYLLRNQSIIKEWINYKMIYFLQRRNPATPNIIEKVSPPESRNLSEAGRFFRILNEKSGLTDIYNSLPLNSSDISIDHFIPWSFVLHDCIWNLAPTTKAMNSKKSDRLFSFDTYFGQFSELQFTAYRFCFDQYDIENNNSEIKKQYIEFLKGTLNPSKTEFTNKLKNVLQPLYYLALNQGFKEFS